MISIVIPSWNTRALLERCLRALAPTATADPSRFKIIVVDDASSDGSADMVLSRFPGVRVLPHSDTRGFAASCNDGARLATGDWILFLNSDAFVSLEQVSRLEEAALAAGAVVVGPQLVYGEGGLQDSGGAFMRPRSVLKTKVGRLLRRDLAGASHRRRVEGIQRVDWVAGACLLIRADVFREVGGFDERLTYVEDVELGERVRRAGHKLVLAGNVRVLHLGGQSFVSIRREVPRRYRESQRLLADAYYTLPERLLTRVAFLIERTVSNVVRP